MKRLLAITAALLLAVTAMAREFAVSGPQGGLSLKVSLPKGFDPARDSCHMVILMHGIFSSKDYPPIPNIAKALAKEGIASIRFDFEGPAGVHQMLPPFQTRQELSASDAGTGHIWGFGELSGPGMHHPRLQGRHSPSVVQREIQ